MVLVLITIVVRSWTIKQEVVQSIYARIIALGTLKWLWNEKWPIMASFFKCHDSQVCTSQTVKITQKVSIYNTASEASSLT